MVDEPRQLRPVDPLHFVELDEFSDDWQRLGLNVENDLWTLQLTLMRDPTAFPVIPGTGGLRKMRFAPSRWQSGKRGAIRVCYAYFEKHWTVLLVMAYGKSRKGTLTAAEKQGISQYLAVVNHWLDQRHS